MLRGERMLGLCSKGSLEDHVPALSDSLRFYFLNVRFSESIIIAVIKSNTTNMFEYLKYKREIMTVSYKAISSLSGWPTHWFKFNHHPFPLQFLR